MEPVSHYAGEYDERSFWEKVRRFALKAGKQVIREAMVLYYCLRDPDTPGRAKVIIMGALGYFILPFDFIPDLIPSAGFTDDLAVLVIATKTVLAYVKPEHRARANELLEWEWQKQHAGTARENGGRKGGPRVSRPGTEEYHRGILNMKGRITHISLRERYRELAHKYHPDKVQNLGVEFQKMAEQKFKDINEAYEYLNAKYGQA
jgi:uncharacterized membrane protein YkvA (DUF1232 family)